MTRQDKKALLDYRKRGVENLSDTETWHYSVLDMQEIYEKSGIKIKKHKIPWFEKTNGKWEVVYK